MGVNICIRRIGRCLKGKFVRENRSKRDTVYISKRFLIGTKKREFGGGNNKSAKVAELNRIKQERKILEEFVQEFRRVAKESGYEERALAEKFKSGISGIVRRKLMEAERPPRSIEQ